MAPQISSTATHFNKVVRRGAIACERGYRMQVTTGITNLIVFSIILRMVICFSEHETEENPGVKK